MTANVSASIRARLRNKAQADALPFDEILRRYGIERLLYRLAQSSYRENFILKGAQLLRVWSADAFRPTMDMDLLGRMNNDLTTITFAIRELCRMEPEADDGLRFDAGNVQAQRIKEDADYHGVRVTLVAFLEKARVPLQIDIGFDDVVTPGPQEVTFPSLLDLPKAELRGYTPESVFAEKLEAMVKLGEQNSRMKDFYDLQFLICMDLLPDTQQLQAAIKETFARRGTTLPADLPVLLRADHPVLDQKQIQWSAFVRKARLTEVPEHFSGLTEELRQYVAPLIRTFAVR